MEGGSKLSTATRENPDAASDARAVAQLTALAPVSEFCLVGRSIFFLDSEGYWSNSLIRNESSIRFARRFLVRNGTPYLNSTDELCALARRGWHPSEPVSATVANVAEAMREIEEYERLAAKLRELGVDPDGI